MTKKALPDVLDYGKENGCDGNEVVSTVHSKMGKAK